MRQVQISLRVLVFVNVTVSLLGFRANALVWHVPYFIKQPTRETCWAAGAMSLAEFYNYGFKNKFTDAWTYSDLTETYDMPYDFESYESNYICDHSDFEQYEIRISPDNNDPIANCGTRFCTILDFNQLNDSINCCQSNIVSCASHKYYDSMAAIFSYATNLDYEISRFSCDSLTTDQCQNKIDTNNIEYKIKYEINRRRLVPIIEHSMMTDHVNIIYGYRESNNEFKISYYDTMGSFQEMDLASYAIQKKSTEFYITSNCSDRSLTKSPMSANTTVRGCFIKASGYYEIDSSKTVIFEAKHYIKLKSGFRASKGSFFHARINPQVSPSD